MTKYGKLQKRISFLDTDKRAADLLIRLKNDGLTKTNFFRAVLTAYLDQDPLMVEFIEETKKKLNSQSKSKSKVVKKLKEKGKQNKDKFGLDENTISNIFDILEKEYPDL